MSRRDRQACPWRDSRPELLLRSECLGTQYAIGLTYAWQGLFKFASVGDTASYVSDMCAGRILNSSPSTEPWPSQAAAKDIILRVSTHHPRFRRGVMTNVVANDKVEVMQPNSSRLLVFDVDLDTGHRTPFILAQAQPCVCNEMYATVRHIAHKVLSQKSTSPGRSYLRR